jgi:O-antigen ligase
LNAKSGRRSKLIGVSPLTKKQDLAIESNQVLGFSSLPALLSFAGLCLLLFFAPSQFAGFWPSDYNFWPQSILLLLLAFVGIMATIARLDIPKPDATFWLISGFLGTVLLSVSVASYKHDAFLELSRVTGALAIFYLTRLFPSPSHRIVLIVAAAVGMLWPSLLALLDFVGTRNPRQFGTFSNPNIFANAIAATLPLALILPVALWTRTRQKNLTLAGILPIVFLLPALAVTSSKGGFLAAIIGVLVTVVALRAARKQAFGKLVRRVLPLVVLGVIGFGALATITVLPRLMAARTTEDNSTQFRVYLWKSTIDMIEAKPLLGHGAGQFPTDYPAYALAGYARTAHQSWLQVAAESGVFSLALLAIATICALVAAKCSLKDENWPFAAGAIGAIVAIFVHGCTDAGWSAIPVVMLFALALGLTTRPQYVEAKQNLNFFWLTATLILALGGYGTQIVARSEDAMRESEALMKENQPRTSIDIVQAELTSDAGSARLWSSWGRLQEALQFGEPEDALKKAIELQPNRASNYLNLARFKSRQGENPNEIEALYETAYKRDPLNTSLLLEWAKWQLDTKSGKGYENLRKILKLWDEPYGKYPAIPEWVNLDFTRATALAWPQLSSQEKSRYKERSMADIATARLYEERNRQILAEINSSVSLNENADLDEMENQLKTLR